MFTPGAKALLIQADVSVHPLAVGRRDIDRYRNWMSELVDADGKPTLHGQPRFAPATVAKRLSAVRSFYGYVVDRGTIDASPAVGVKVPRTPRKPRGHAITENQVAKLIAAAQDHSDTSEAIVRLLVLTGQAASVGTFCVALDINALVYTYNGSFWTGPTASGTHFGVVAVSCVSASFCGTAPLDSSATPSVFDGQTWVAPRPIAPFDVPAQPVTQVFCTFCK